MLLCSILWYLASYFGTIVYHQNPICRFWWWWWWFYHWTIWTKLSSVQRWSCIFTHRWRRIIFFCPPRGCCSFMWTFLPLPLLAACLIWRAVHGSTMFYLCEWLVSNKSWQFSLIFYSYVFVHIPNVSRADEMKRKISEGLFEQSLVDYCKCTYSLDDS